MYIFLRDVIFKVLVVNWSSVRNSSSSGIFKKKDTREWLRLTLVRYDDKFLRQPLVAAAVVVTASGLRSTHTFQSILYDALII